MDRITKKLIAYRMEKSEPKQKKLAAEIIHLIEKQLDGSNIAHIKIKGGAIFGKKAKQTGPEKITFTRDIQTELSISEIVSITFYVDY